MIKSSWKRNVGQLPNQLGHEAMKPARNLEKNLIGS